LFDLFNNEDVIHRIAQLLDEHGPQIERCIYATLAGFLQLSDRETRPSVLGSTQQHLMLWESNLIRSLTDHTSFDLRAFVEGEPMTIYIVPGALRVEAYGPCCACGLQACFRP
jgi:type IV secretory pathway TraG/TraD family ATPase VirD4